MSKARRLILLFDKMVASRQNFDTHWDEVARWVCPTMDYVFERRSNISSKGEERHNRTFDQTAEHAGEILAAGLHSIISNPTQEFIDLTTLDPETDAIARVRSYMQKTVRKAHEILSNSNFHIEAHSVYLDDVYFGTGIVEMDEDPEEFVRFESSPPFTHWIWENHKKEVSVVATQVKMHARDILAKYGMIRITDESVKNALLKDLDAEHDVIKIVMDKETARQRGFDKETSPFVSFHILKDRQFILKTIPKQTFPYAAPRFYKLSGEMYGRSPGMKALPETRYLNQVKKTVLRAGQKATDPPMLVNDDSVLGRVNVRPGGLTSVRSNSRDNPPITPMISGSRPDIGREMVEESRREIRKAFYEELLQVQLGDRATTDEVNVRNNERMWILGPVQARMSRELLLPVTRFVLHVMAKRNLMPPNPPPELINRPLALRFKTQITKAQKALEAQSAQQWIAAIAPLASVDPTVTMVVNSENYARKLARDYSVDEDLLNTPEQVQSQKQQMQQAQQQAEEAQNAESASKVVGNIQK